MLLLICTLSLQVQGQSYVDDAKYLSAFYQLYQQNQQAVIRNNNITAGSGDRIDLSEAEGRKNLAIAVANYLNTSQLGPSQHQASSPPNGRPQPNAAVQVSPAASNGSEFTSTASAAGTPMANPQIENEIAMYVAFVTEDLSSLLTATSLNNFPSQFKYLSDTVEVLLNDDTGQFTSGFGVGSIVGVSQSQILQGIAEWALKRAEQELMQSFLREWLQKIQSDPILRQTFPNTLNMLSTSDLSSIVTDGSTWKATFLQDFDNIPANSPLIFKAILENSELKLDPAVSREIEAGLDIMASLSKDIGLNKPADQVISLLGKQSLLKVQSQTTGPVAIIDRTLIGAELLLSLIRKEEAQGNVSYITTNEVTSLTANEMQMLWKLVVKKNYKQLQLLFDINGTAAIDFYEKVSSEVASLQLQLASMAQTIEGINTMIDDISKTASQEISKSQYASYVTLIFDIVETTLTTVKTLGVDLPIFSKIETYSTKYLNGLKYITTIQQGISTKQYGIVALNTLNFFLWIKETIAGGTQYTDLAWNDISKVDELLKLADKFKPDKKETLTLVFDQLEKQTQKQLSKYPNIASMLVSNFDVLEQSLIATPNLTLEKVKSDLASVFNFDDSQKRLIAKDIASNKLANLQSTSEAINKYGKLMATIILAETSEDIEKALESVANESGGYMMRQKSYFSTTLSFYPGAAAGIESTKVTGQESTKGSFASATLPIGVEMAVGTNWKPIGAVGLFVQILDLGAVLNYSLSNDNEELSSNPDIGFKQVLSPGGFITLHITNSPITLGLGAKYLPSLRTITTAQDVELQANSLQVGAFLAVDLNVFTISGSKKKFSLDSKSIKTAYNND